METWPKLEYMAWRDTYATLHRWLQIVGKIRNAQAPWINHSWHVSLLVTLRGLSTRPVPHGKRAFQIDFDFIDHRLAVMTSDGGTRMLPLGAQPVAAFYRDLMGALDELGVPVRIARKPNEMKDEEAVPFDEDESHRAYDADAVNRFWRVLVQCERVMSAFRAVFRGKSSPVHFFWGNMDLALTRFSGRRAPQHPGGRPNLPDAVLRDAYSHECSECGFWPGGEEHPEPVFYSLAYPMPKGFKEARVAPRGACYSEELGEFVLPYRQVRESADPDAAVFEFLQSTYEAAANLGAWDRAELEYNFSPAWRSRARIAR